MSRRGKRDYSQALANARANNLTSDGKPLSTVLGHNGRPLAESDKPNKYRNEPCQDKDGRKFDSKKERAIQGLLEMDPDNAAVLRQVSIIVSDGAKPVRMRLDHLVITEVHKDGSFCAYFADTKGMEPTQGWKDKVKMLENSTGLKVKVLR